MKLKGKVAIVTGASSGIGYEIAFLFASEGAKVVAVARREERLEEMHKNAKDLAGEIFNLQADLANTDEIENIFEETMKKYGRVDILVNNAALMDDFSSVENVTDEMWNKVMNIDLRAPMITMRKAVPIFKENGGGNIINIASVAGLNGGRGGATYTAAKHALIGLTKNTALQYTEDNIRCNAICPGVIETEVDEGEFLKDENQEDSSTIMDLMGPDPVSGKPEDIAQAALFLASSESSFITGHALVADGGWTAY